MRIGLGVSRDAVRAVAVDEGRVCWGAESILEGKSLGSAVAELLAAAPRRRWSRPVIVAAVGPARAQLRRLSGLPPVLDAASLTRVVSESAGRFFLRNGVRLVTTGVRPDGYGEGWSAAIELPVVTELDAACRAAGARLTGVLPTMSVIQHSLRGGELTWHDGDVSAEVTLADGRLHAVRRVACAGAVNGRTSAENAPAVKALEVLGEEAWRFADAYGAAIASPSDALVHRPTRTSVATRVPAWRLGAAGAACVVALSSALVAPPMRARHAAVQANKTLAALAPARRLVVADESDLARVSGALGEVAAFGNGRRSMTLLLADLAQALPTGSALVSVSTDSAGGTLVALAPRAALLIDKLEHMPDFGTLTIVGPVTREVAAAAEVERVTLRFRWADAPANRVSKR